MKDYFCLQEIISPLRDHENQGLYIHCDSSDRNLCMNSGRIPMTKGASFCLDTYFNSFSYEKWVRYTGIEKVYLGISGTGTYEIRWIQAWTAEGKVKEQCISDTVIHFEEMDSEKNRPLGSLHKTNLKYVSFEGDRLSGKAIIYPKITCLSQEGVIMAAAYYTDQAPLRPVHPALVICTYHREQEAAANIDLIKEMVSLHKDEASFSSLRIYLVDNGQSMAGYEHDPVVRYYPNPNIGGSGGFVRGIVEAAASREDVFTHMVLMDDDADLIPGAVERMLHFLSYLKPEYDSYTICGGLLRREMPWIQAESGAEWNHGLIKGCMANTDMSLFENVLFNEASIHQPEYSGWWFSCIPVSVIRDKGLPMPMFLHRDDVEYGLRMEGRFITLNGICTCHETYDTKLPQVSEYYDVRNYAITEALHNPDFQASSLKKTLIKWIIGNLFRYRYRYAYMNIRAAEDFLRGASWLQKQDMGQLHKKIAAMAYRTVQGLKPAADNSYEHLIRAGKKGALSRLRLLLSYPFPFRKNIETSAWQSVYDYACSGSAVTRDQNGNYIEVRKNMAETIRILLKLPGLMTGINHDFQKACDSYRRAYPYMISEKAWMRRWQ